MKTLLMSAFYTLWENMKIFITALMTLLTLPALAVHPAVLAQYQEEMVIYPLSRIQIKVVEKRWVPTTCYVSFEVDGVEHGRLSPNGFEGNRVCRALGETFTEHKTNNSATHIALLINEYEASYINDYHRYRKVIYINIDD